MSDDFSSLEPPTQAIDEGVRIPEHDSSPFQPPETPSAPGSGSNIRITAADLNGEDVEMRVQQLRSAVAPQLVREVGEKRKKGLGVAGVILSMALAGLIGGLLGWAVSEGVTQNWKTEQALNDSDVGSHLDYACVQQLPQDATRDEAYGCFDFGPWYGWNNTVGTIVFLGSFGLTLGIVIAGWDAISARSLSKFVNLLIRSVIFLVCAVLIGGFLAQKAFEYLASDMTDAGNLHVPRAVAWSIFGTLLGLAIGASTKAVRRTVQGGAGGLIGGFVGGFVFDYISISETDGLVNRLVGLTITGFAIALAMSLIEVATRQHWLEIVSGGMAGKQFILYRDVTTVGSSPSCDVTLIKDPSMAPRHLQLTTRGENLEAMAFDPTIPVSVNGTQIHQAQLRDADMIQLGSTILRYRAKKQQMPTGMPLPKRRDGKLDIGVGGGEQGQLGPTPPYQAPPPAPPVPTAAPPSPPYQAPPPPQ